MSILASLQGVIARQTEKLERINEEIVAIIQVPAGLKVLQWMKYQQNSMTNSPYLCSTGFLGTKPPPPFVSETH